MPGIRRPRRNDVDLARICWRKGGDEFFEARIAAQWIRNSVQLQRSIFGRVRIVDSFFHGIQSAIEFMEISRSQTDAAFD